MKRESLSAKLGSIAAVAGEDGAAVQRVWYFASGLPVTENAATAAVNSRLHIGKEFTGFDGLWWYDNDARQYDPLTMRFTTLDPLAANYPSLSPYSYCANNPVNYIDPDGKQISGYTRGDALEFQKDINTVLSNDKFSEFRKLLVVDDSGVFQKVENYESVLPSQTEDEKAFTSMLVDAINSPRMHTVEYVEGHASEKGSKLFVDEWNSSCRPEAKLVESNILPEYVISKSYAGGTTFPVNGKDSYSLVVKNKAPIERAVITFHEVGGHGIPLSNGITGALNDLNSVRTSNLIIRTITQDSNSTWGHSDHKNIDFINKNNPQAMPMLK